MIELRHLKTLTALREHGSLVAAAGDLCLTPSSFVLFFLKIKNIPVIIMIVEIIIIQKFLFKI